MTATMELLESSPAARRDSRGSTRATRRRRNWSWCTIRATSPPCSQAARSRWRLGRPRHADHAALVRCRRTRRRRHAGRARCGARRRRRERVLPRPAARASRDARAGDGLLPVQPRRDRRARSARATHGLERVAIVDFDVHHGNGTQDAFYADAPTCSTSRRTSTRSTPAPAPPTETGEAPGRGYNINIPLPAGCGDADYAAGVRGDRRPRAARASARS